MLPSTKAKIDGRMRLSPSHISWHRRSSSARVGCYAFILSIVWTPSVRSETSSLPVFIAGSSKPQCFVSRVELDGFDDLAYDRVRRRLYSLTVQEAGITVREWSSAGKLIGSWALQSEQAYTSILFIRNGRLAFLTQADSERILTEIKVPVDSRDPLAKAVVDQDLITYDSALGKTQRPVILELLARSIVSPVPTPSGDVARPDPSLRSYLLHVPSILDNCVSWSPDLGTVAFGTRLLAPVVITRTRRHPAAGIESRSVEAAIREAVKRQHDGLRARRLLNLHVTRSAGTYGVSSGEGAHTIYKMVWIDLNRAGWPVSRVTTGVLAREVMRY